MQNKKGNVAIVTIIVVIVAITAGIIGWMFAKKSQSTAPEPVGSQQTAKVEQVQPKQQKQVDETANWQTYKNNQFGFNLQLPADWKGYTTKIENNSVSFSLPKYEGAFNVTVYTNAEWAKKQNSGDIITEEVLGTNNKYTYTFGQGMLLAGGNTPENDPEITAQLKEVDIIKKTFKITQ